MRNFRTAAVASATAVTVILGGTAIASAQTETKTETSTSTTTAAPTTTSNEKTTPAEPTATATAKVANDKQVVFIGEQKDDKPISQVISDGTAGLFGGKGSSQYVYKEDAETPFYITDAFGKKTNPELVPQWARIWIDTTVVAGIGAIIGLVIAGINFASYNGWITLPSF